MHANGEGVEADNYSASKAFLHGCKFNGDPAECKKALIYGKHSCNEGSIQSCELISDMYKELDPKYFDQKNVGNGPVKANEYSEKACELGSARNCALAANNHMSGKGIKKNTENGERYFRKACEGISSFCGYLAQLYLQGETITKDIDSAVKYSNIGCDKQDHLSCGILGLLYINGEGVMQSNSKGVNHLKKGCKYGSEPACKILGQAYIRGDIVKADSSMALKYYINACKKSERYRDSDCEKLTTKDLPKVN